MTLTKVKKVKIDRLQPTQPNLTENTLLYLEETNPNLEKIELPEVHEINGVLYVADGHNKLFFQTAYLGRRKALCKYFTPENSNVTPQLYSQIASDLQIKAQMTKERGIYSIQDLV